MLDSGFGMLDSGFADSGFGIRGSEMRMSQKVAFRIRDSGFDVTKSCFSDSGFGIRCHKKLFFGFGIRDSMSQKVGCPKTAVF